ncbi:hypothetical protein [Streptomyces subrutilus]|uniref:Uncharacterized protein n=1 Tax=Streptomyces subrutilus TaxID=36818 RepID=A0A1E5NY22_9ACTN|nr:hypothetical protein [Streptomyces subrutilus]OEJ21037.1 hypothetical protein BGK67_34640 [Streptomyces subrutilus]
MHAALAVKPMAELTAQYGPMRTVLQSHGPTDVEREQHETYSLVVHGGKPLRQSRIGAALRPELVIQLVEYVDPVTGTLRYAVDYWTPARFLVSDHEHRVMAEMAYEKAVRDEFAYTALRLSPQRFLGGLELFYDVTDVRP